MDNFPISLEHHCNLISNESMSSAAIYAKDSTINRVVDHNFWMSRIRELVGRPETVITPPLSKTMIVPTSLRTWDSMVVNLVSRHTIPPPVSSDYFTASGGIQYG
jgi:hypothetical protein